MNNILLKGSDKEYWHRYIPMYEDALASIGKCDKILEFGVFKGESIRWLSDKYPDAQIFAGDILPQQPEWPVAENIKYIHLDQGKQQTIKELFTITGNDLDLIIEDGSHFPEHQKNCLIEGIDHLSSGGIYILEDLHTSHPEHPYYKTTGLRYRSYVYRMMIRLLEYRPFGAKCSDNLKWKLMYSTPFIGPLHLVLCIEHLKSTGQELNENVLKDFTYRSLFTPKEVVDLFQKISAIQIYKRATLPHKCYACGSANFKMHSLQCECGIGLYSNSDSIVAIIHIK